MTLVVPSVLLYNVDPSYLCCSVTGLVQTKTMMCWEGRSCWRMLAPSLKNEDRCFYKHREEDLVYFKTMRNAMNKAEAESFVAVTTHNCSKNQVDNEV